ncbi:MAG: ABC transporter substrate-binding protein [Rhodobacteraceae bacterium]|uniref:MlaC/ttg2D family ABC transporter substrate-binding protein n=1 Tax=Amaricoccus sp. B4 TaxID=3368557 RepID=UPI0013A6A22C|nr:ABC transporter substrate-binding protein [Paracoccaceae bacterium]
MMTTDLGTGLARRGFLAATALLAGAAALPRPLLALTVPQAQAFVGSISGELDRLVNSGRSGSQLYSQFEQILARYADMPVVGASVLGPPWRSATSAQKSAFISTFQSYLARKYGRQFEEYRNARIQVTGGKDAGRAGVLINTTVVRPGRENIGVDWQISDRSGSAKAVNLIIEGVSLLATERAEIGAILDSQGGSIDKLIAELRRRS